MKEPIQAVAHQMRIAHAVHGIVSAVDPSSHAVKVRLQPEDIETGWLPDTALALAGDLQLASPCSLGSHVLLIPIEGNGESYVIASSLFDVVALPPVSPVTGKVAQPGELLIRAGRGAKSQSAEPDKEAAWFHLGRNGIFLGIGAMRCTIGGDAIVFHAGSVEMTLSAKGLTLRGAGMSINGGDIVVSGGDVRTELNSLSGHIHPAPNGMTGKPVG